MDSKTNQESLIKRIEQLEEKVQQLEAALTKQNVSKPHGKRGRPSTVDDEIVAEVRKLLDNGETVRSVLKKLNISRTKFYAVKARLHSYDNSNKNKNEPMEHPVSNCSDKLQQEQKNTEPSKEEQAAQLVDLIKRGVFFNGTITLTKKNWNSYFKKTAQFLFQRRDTLDQDVVALAIHQIFSGFLNPMHNRLHSKKLCDFLVMFQK